MQPTKEVNEPWVWCKPKKQVVKNPSKVGKWMIFVDLDKLDDVWGIVKENTEKGNLGILSKCATNAPTPTKFNKKVICVYTYDYDDLQDVAIIGYRLFNLIGDLTNLINYKTDEATYNNDKSSKYTIYKNFVDSLSEKDFVDNFSKRYGV